MNNKLSGRKLEEINALRDLIRCTSCCRGQSIGAPATSIEAKTFLSVWGESLKRQGETSSELQSILGCNMGQITQNFSYLISNLPKCPSRFYINYIKSKAGILCLHLSSAYWVLGTEASHRQPVFLSLTVCSQLYHPLPTLFQNVIKENQKVSDNFQSFLVKQVMRLEVPTPTSVLMGKSVWAPSQALVCILLVSTFSVESH